MKIEKSRQSFKKLTEIFHGWPFLITSGGGSGGLESKPATAELILTFLSKNFALYAKITPFVVVFAQTTLRIMSTSFTQ